METAYPTIYQWIVQYGYIGIFVGLVLGIVAFPIPDEALLTCAGYLVYAGGLKLIPTMTVAFLGCVCGISVSYWLGRALGFYLIVRFGRFASITEEKLNNAHDWYGRWGRWGLMFGYFVPGIRHLTAFIAGATKLKLPVFALFAYGGGLIWSVTFISAGYWLGKEWAQTAEKIHHRLLIGTAIVVLSTLFYFLWRRRNRARI